MNEQATVETYQGIEVPASPQLKVERKNKYGSLPGLEDEELASPEELERMAVRAEWGPVLELPVSRKEVAFRPDVDEDGFVVGAFASVDFERIKSGFEKGLYKAEKLREQLRDTVSMFEMIRHRLPKSASLVLRYLRKGIIELEHISHVDTWQLGTLYLRARSLRKQILELEEASWRRRRRQAELFFDSLG